MCRDINRMHFYTISSLGFPLAQCIHVTKQRLCTLVTRPQCKCNSSYRCFSLMVALKSRDIVSQGFYRGDTRARLAKVHAPVLRRTSASTLPQVPPKTLKTVVVRLALLPTGTPPHPPLLRSSGSNIFQAAVALAPNTSQLRTDGPPTRGDTSVASAARCLRGSTRPLTPRSRTRR